MWNFWLAFKVQNYNFSANKIWERIFGIYIELICIDLLILIDTLSQNFAALQT